MDEQKRQRLIRYKKSLWMILSFVIKSGSLELNELKEQLTPEDLHVLIPTVEIFKEIVIELLQAKEIDIEQLKREQLERTFEQSLEFQLNQCLLEVLEESFKNQQIQKVRAMRTERDEVVKFEQVVDEHGRKKSIQCSNIRFEVS